LNTNDDNNPTILEENKIPYTFIGTKVISLVSGAEDQEPGIRRDASDVARDEGS